MFARDGQLIRVSRKHPCLICGRPDWCRVHSTGKFAICNRVPSADPALSNGWVHRLDGCLPTTTVEQTARRGTAVASVEARDLVYRRLLQHLDLSSQHRTELRGRGLGDREIAAMGFASLPVRGRARICRLVAQTCPSLVGIPGFYTRREADRCWVTLAGPAGLLIPVKNAGGLIQSLLVRRDAGDPKYVWLSSAGRPGGCSSSAPVHVARPLNGTDDNRLWITEGPLKADIASVRLRAIVIGIPGVASWRAGLEVVHAVQPEKGVLVVAFDMDSYANPHVAAHRDELVCAARQSGWEAQLAEWNAVKGIDDALVAGIDVQIRPVRFAVRRRSHVRRRLLARRTVVIGGPHHA